MASNNREAIDTFMNITGLSEPVAVQKLEEYGGDLNQAVNAHFFEGDRNVSSSVQERRALDLHDNLMDIDDPLQSGAHQSQSIFSGTTNPFSILDSAFGGGLSDVHSNFSNQEPIVTHTRELGEIPIEVKHSNQSTSQSSSAPAIEDGTGNALAHGTVPIVTHPRELREIPIEVKHRNQSTSQSSPAPAIEDGTGNALAHGTVIVDDNNDEAITHGQNAQDHSEPKSNDVGSSHGQIARPSAPGFENSPDFVNDIEEEMIRAAIEASKREVDQRHPNHPFEAQAKQSNFEDPELAHAVSLSLKTAEQEKALREVGDAVVSKVAPFEPSDVGLVNTSLSNGRLEMGSSSVQDESEDLEEEPLVRQRFIHASSGTVELPSDVEARTPASTVDDSSSHLQHNASSFPTDEWGGMSSEEHDEAVMLEAAMFGGIPEGSRYHYAYAPHQFMRHESPYPRPAARPPSPSLTAQRLIREQQDDEYLASLQADREKELLAKEEAEAAREEERQREEETHRKLQEEQELERQLAAKEVSLPREPSSDDENGVTLLVRLPDGSRRGRRFLKSDSLQSLFDFIDVARVVKPGTYRLVRPYPRRAFSDGESSLTLNELGLTSKQEALFLELI